MLTVKYCLYCSENRFSSVGYGVFSTKLRSLEKRVLVRKTLIPRLVHVLCLLSILKFANEEEALVNVAEIGKIETKEAQSRKEIYSKGEETEWKDKETDLFIDLL